MPGQRVADDQLLDGEGLGDVAALKRADDRFGDAEIGKRNDVICSFLSVLGEIQRPLNAKAACGGNGTSRAALGQTRRNHRSSHRRIG